MGREQRFVFGEVADLYDRARPGYPEALVDDVLECCGLPAPRVLEVGAGTGKATVAFAARGLEIVALEPPAGRASGASRAADPREMSAISAELRASGRFSQATLRSYHWARHYTIEQYLDLMRTHSDHRMLAERDRRALLEGAADVLARRGGRCQIA